MTEQTDFLTGYSSALESTNHIIIDVPKKINSEVWDDIANTIESACRDL